MRTALLIPLLGLACSTQQEGRLYSLKDGRATPIVIQTHSANGTLQGSLPSGEACTGDVASVTDDAPGVEETPSVGRNAERGVVVLACGNGDVLRCVLARRLGEGFSYGDCKDQHGVEYAMMF